MKQKKKVITTISIVLIVLSLLIISSIISNNKSNNNSINICDKINKEISSKDGFILYINVGNMDSERKEAIEEFSKEYKEVKSLSASYNDLINQECFKKSLEKTGLYEGVKNNETSAIIMYKDGENIGAIFGAYDFYSIEKYAVKKGLMKKHDIKETVSLEKFKEYIKDEYILVMAGNKKGRTTVTPMCKKHFNDYKYDIISITSTEGEKIYDYVKENYEIGDVFPQAVYFKNGKKMAEEKIFSLDSDYERFLNSIQEIKNQN